MISQRQGSTAVPSNSSLGETSASGSSQTGTSGSVVPEARKVSASRSTPPVVVTTTAPEPSGISVRVVVTSSQPSAPAHPSAAKAASAAARAGAAGGPGRGGGGRRPAVGAGDLGLGEGRVRTRPGEGDGSLTGAAGGHGVDGLAGRRVREGHRPEGERVTLVEVRHVLAGARLGVLDDGHALGGVVPLGLLHLGLEIG